MPRATWKGFCVGIKQVDDGVWIVSVMHYDLGFIDLEQPLRYRVVTHVLGTFSGPDTDSPAIRTLGSSREPLGPLQPNRDVLAVNPPSHKARGAAAPLDPFAARGADCVPDALGRRR
jgi:hypothetical protein